MMTYEEIKALTKAHNALSKAILKTFKSYLIDDQSARYATLAEFYCEDGHIVAEIDFAEPYQGSSTMRMDLSEIDMSEIA